ncbi:glycosyltransferase involved in cell wall biosynthesis [Caldalkalibacillus uzonensis]|uniref:Glycosyltransferase involved in cell wall biosynthesis n=1 Tax=Caldalkalibacillus uzonensis TaxID=353224 RepID=A0ABU0CV52_9BACI|nr:glycosyltransferase family 1 protein [Caldalkalibacillus uzonensis]MDQ0340298.1 glycosyltransferase involved in cell wall biosynthesis [Caldalkalibacillus uzonensis]
MATPFNVGLFGVQYARKHGIPLVASYHTHFDEYLRYYNLSFMEKWIWHYMRWFHRPAKKVYVPSQSTKEKLLHHRVHNNLEIWPRGVDHYFFSPAHYSPDIRHQYGQGKRILALYVGRLAPEKDVPTAIHSFLSLPKPVIKQTQLIIVGDGPLYSDLCQVNSPHITLAGFKQGRELAQLYASSDLFLFPSPTETFGNVVLEAMASGLPVIGANGGGVKHLVQEGQNGYLCPPRDVRAFRHALLKLVTEHGLRLQLGRNSRLLALQHSWTEVFQRLVESSQEVSERNHQASA